MHREKYIEPMFLQRTEVHYSRNVMLPFDNHVTTVKGKQINNHLFSNLDDRRAELEGAVVVLHKDTFPVSYLAHHQRLEQD